MCLLVFAWQTGSDHPLVVAANRDELLERPAHALCVLREDHPRILGGRDELGGGTWLAVNEHGVVAGLTNRPSPGGRDPTKRSRGELPLIAASKRTAREGVEELVRRVRPGEYNLAWLLVGDRRSLHYIELTHQRELTVRELEPGIHVLENTALDHPSPKIDRVRSLLAEEETALWNALPTVLADHTVPEQVDLAQASDPEIERRPATFASCVHTDDYGTRSAALVRVPSRLVSPPSMLVADGPPCIAAFSDVTHCWR